MTLLGQDTSLKLANLLIVLALSAYWLFATPSAPPLWQISLCAYFGVAYLLATLVPGNALRINLWPDRKRLWRSLALRRRTFGLMSGLWFFGHYNLGVKMLRVEIGGPQEIQPRYDPVLDNGQLATFIFMILFVTSYGWAMRALKADWRRVHGLAWFVVPLILVHSISARLAFEQRLPHVSLAMLLGIILFALYEFRMLSARNHQDRARHLLLLLAGTVVAVCYRFFYR